MASSSNERSILDLPDEILIIILENLNVEDLKRISLVNSRFYELVTTTSSVNKKFKLKIDPNYNATIIEALIESNRHFKNLAIPSSKHEDDEPCKSSQIIDFMKKVGGHVKNMEIKYQNKCLCPNQIFELLRTMPNIESFIFRLNFNILECAEKLPTTIFNFNQLKEVRITFEMIFRILKHVNTLEKLIVFESDENDLKYGSKILELFEVLRNNQSTLKSLKFTDMKEFFEHDIQALCNLNLFEFEYFASYFNKNTAKMNNFVKFLSNQHQMKSLSISMSNVFFWDPIMKMTNLEFLYLSLENNLCNEQILAILQDRTNISVKSLIITSKFKESNLKLCQTIVEYFSGVVDLHLRFYHTNKEFPEGWFLSFDDHPALKKVSLDTSQEGRAQLRVLKIKQLERLNIDLVHDLTADDWNSLTTNNPNIKSLSIYDTSLETESLECIVNNLKHLEEFIFNTNDEEVEFKYEDLRLILENSQNIKKIDVRLNEEPESHSEILEEFAEKLKTIKLTVKFGSDYEDYGRSDESS